MGDRKVANCEIGDIVELFMKVYKKDLPNDDDIITNIGFDSVSAIKLIGKIKKKYGVAVSIKMFFRRIPFGELMSQIVQKVNGDNTVESSEKATIPRTTEKKEVYAATIAQKAMYIAMSMGEKNTSYNITMVMEILGECDYQRLEQSVQKMIAKHEILRTGFEIVNNEIFQRIHDSIEFTLPCKQVQRKDLAEEIENVIEAYNLELPPLFKFCVLKTEEKNYLVFDICHMISDGTSVSLMFKELVENYKGIDNFKNDSIAFRDYSEWMNERLKSDIIEKQGKYWRDSYAGDINIKSLPSDYVKKNSYGIRGENLIFNIGEEITDKLRKITTEKNTSLYMVLFAIYNIWLSKITSSDDIVVAVPITGREYEETQSTLGLFMNTLLIRNHIKPEVGFFDFLDQVKDNLLLAYENQEFPLDNVVDILKEKNVFVENRFNEIISVFNYLNIDSTEGDSDEVDFFRYQLGDGVSFQRVSEYGNSAAKYGLSIFLYDTPKGIKIKFNYKLDYFKRETMQYMVEEFIALIQQIVEKSDNKLSEYSIFGINKVIDKKNTVGVDEDRAVDFAREDIEHSIVSRFSKIAEKYKSQTAIVAKDATLTYEELDKKSNQIARKTIEEYDDSNQLTSEEMIRYTRQMSINGWGIAGQEKLKGTTVFIAGAGGSASPIVYQMALVGVGTIVIADFDEVELSNLNRQFLHDESRIGMSKVESAKQTIERINPNVKVIAYNEKISKENLDKMLNGASVIFDNVDDLETKFVLSECAVKYGIPHVLSSMIEMSSYSTILLPPYTPCFHCLYDQNKLAEIEELKRAVKDYKKTAAPVACPSLFASTGFICNEVLKLIVGNGKAALNKYFFFNQSASEDFAKTTGFMAITYPFSKHFKNLCLKQGFNWEKPWTGKFVEEFELEKDPNCTLCKDITELPEKQKEINIVQTSAKGPGRRTVALLFDQGSSMIAAMLGVLKTGMIYVPLDPKYPREHLEYRLSDSKSRVVVTDSKNIEYANELVASVNANIKVINIDVLQDISKESIDQKVEASDYAYILYTSGSTGRPKGVLQTHRNLLHFIQVYTNNLKINHTDHMTLFSSYCFDAAIMDIYGAILNGATLYPVDIMNAANIDDVFAEFQKNAITIYHSIPTVYRFLINKVTDDNLLSSIRLVVLGGEAVVKSDLDLYKKHFSDECLFVNGLGPTESTITLQYWMDKNSDISRNAVPVGFPVDHTKVYILNESGEKTKFFEEGEIYYQSDYLAKEYWEKPEETSKAFVYNPDTKERAYRSGDRGKYLLDGTIEFAGRNDFQVKIRGYRIEIGEIESAMQRIDVIKECVVICKQNENGGAELVAYYTKQENTGVETSQIREQLRAYLPVYMIPAYYFDIEQFPLTTSGKIDRKALNDMELAFEKQEVEFRAAEDSIEEEIVAIWTSILEYGQIGTDNSFFDIGGNSLSLVQMHSILKEKFATALTITDIFNLRTVRKIASYIRNEKNIGEAVRKLGYLELAQKLAGSNGNLDEMSETTVKGSKDVLQVLYKVAKQENIVKEDILVALFGYTIAQISDVEKFSIQTAVKEYSVLQETPFDFTSIESLADLFIKTSDNLSNCNEKMDVKKLDANQFDKTSDRIFSIVYDRAYAGAVTSQITKLYDFSLEYFIQGEEIYFKCCSNGSLEKVFVQQVIKLFMNNLGSLKAAYKIDVRGGENEELIQ